MYTCASCAALACAAADHAGMPKNCPMCNEPLMESALRQYEPDRDFFLVSSEIEGVGYGKWPRLREIVEFCKRLDYRKVGMAFCRGLRGEAKVIDRILRAHGLEVVSVICKTGGVPKERMGVEKQYKLHPEAFEPMCNPIAQAALLNEQQTQFNIAVGLCVGHDSLFFKHSQALATTLIAKDRVLAHNPAGAVYCAHGYFHDKLMPQEEQ